MKLKIRDYVIMYDTAGCFVIWKPEKEKILKNGVVKVDAKYPGTLYQALKLVRTLLIKEKSGTIENLDLFIKELKQIDKELIEKLKELKIQTEEVDRKYFFKD